MENEEKILAVVQWILGNPEKVALFLVLLAGAWRWLKELRSVDRSEDAKESFMESIMQENRKLREELREERKKTRRLGADENSGRNA